MPKVTQKEKKNKLLNEFLFSQKGKTRKQISKHWERYRGKKHTITELPKYRKKYYRAKDEMAKAYLREKYFERKERLVQKLEYGSLKIQKRVKQKFSEQTMYILKRGRNLDSTIDRVFSDKRKKVRYVLVTLKIKNPDTGQIYYVSDTLNPKSWQDVKDSEQTMLEKILDKLTHVAKYDGFELVSQHLRLIYALPEKSKK